MMKSILKIFLVVVMLFPLIVFAGGSDDDSAGAFLMSANCVYEQQSVISGTHGELEGNGTYINILFRGIDNSTMPGTTFTYSFGDLDANGKFKKNYEYDFADRWLNYMKGYGSEYWLQAWWTNLTLKDNGKTLSESKLQEKADNGDFCPEQVLVVQAKKNDKYYFVSARDNQERIDSENALIEDGKYKNIKTYFFTGTSLTITNLGQEKFEETNAEEKVEEGKQNIDDYCDTNSVAYDEKKCTESKIVSNATEETAERIISYNPDNGNIELEKINYGQVTCATIFQETINGTVQYNSTHKLLSTTLRFVQYLAVIIALVLSVIDYIKVVPTQDKDALMKATKNAALRLGIAIVIFFIPIVLNFILGLIGFNDPTCGLL